MRAATRSIRKLKPHDKPSTFSVQFLFSMNTLESNSVLIPATEQTRYLAKKVVDAQCAVNPRAIARLLVEVQDYFGNGPDGMPCGTVFANHNPLALAVLAALMELAHKYDHLSSLWPMDALKACEKLAAGEDIEWDYPNP